jgi:hypothetical protein
LLPHSTQKEKFQGLTWWWERHANFLALQRNNSLGVCDHRQGNELQDLREDPKKKKQHIASTGEKNPTDPGTSGGIESIRYEVVSYLPSSLYVALSDLWLFSKWPPFNCMFC